METDSFPPLDGTGASPINMQVKKAISIVNSASTVKLETLCNCWSKKCLKRFLHNLSRSKLEVKLEGSSLHTVDYNSQFRGLELPQFIIFTPYEI